MIAVLLTAALVTSPGVRAQQLPNPYGLAVSLENAKKAVAAATAEAQKHELRMAIAVADVSGELVYFEKMDGTQTASVQIAMDKARSSVMYKRPTKLLEDALADGPHGLRYLQLHGAISVEGGIPLIMDGKIVGAIGVSGGTNTQDGEVARAGAVQLR
jgi:glc operon protein GlcG